MQAIKEKITEESFLGAIYKNAKMGSDAIIDLCKTMPCAAQ